MLKARYVLLCISIEKCITCILQCFLCMRNGLAQSFTIGPLYTNYIMCTTVWLIENCCYGDGMPLCASFAMFLTTTTLYYTY